MLQVKLSNPIPFNPLVSYFILSYPISSYPLLSYTISLYPTLSSPISSSPTLYPISSCPNLFYLVLSYPILSCPILSCPIVCAVIGCSRVIVITSYLILLHLIVTPNLSHPTHLTIPCCTVPHHVLITTLGAKAAICCDYKVQGSQHYSAPCWPMHQACPLPPYIKCLHSFLLT